MKNNSESVSPGLLRVRYDISRKVLLVIFALSLFNTANVMFGGTEYYIYFSSIPYYLAYTASYLTGKLPNAYYTDWPETLPFFGMSEYWIRVIPAIAIIFLFLVVYWLTKKTRPILLALTAVYVVADTVYRFVVFEFGVWGVIEIMVAFGLVFVLISGTLNGYRLKRLPPQTETETEQDDHENLD